MKENCPIKYQGFLQTHANIASMLLVQEQTSRQVE